MRSLSKWGIPIVISFAALAYLSKTLDFSGVAGEITPRAALILVPALIVYGIVSLVIEAFALRCITPYRPDSGFDLLCAARVKAASYLLAILHYGLGAGTLSLLLRRRAGISLAESAGVVITIMMFDLGMLATLAAVGVTLMTTSNIELQFAVIFAIIAVIVGGLALLRAPFSLGPLDRLRDLELFRAARGAATRDLVVLAFLRLLFVCSFQMLCWAAFVAFEISVPIPDMMLRFALVALAGVAPAVAGIGPSNLALVELFKTFASPETLLACSLALAACMIVMRALIGFLFAGEFSREAYSLAREGAVVTEGEA
jgi:hypothetical protein